VQQTIRALIVDDEPLARTRVRVLLEPVSEVTIVGECTNGLHAVRAILKLQPDLVFLDIQMPELNGFEVIQTIGPEKMPAVIFVTAYDRYAVKAFEVHAVDYLLKPFDRSRFLGAVERALHEISLRKATGLPKNVRALLDTVQTERQITPRILAKSGGRVTILTIDQIDWIEAVGNYIQLHVGRETHLLRETMRNMEHRLPPDRFARIHRSTIVNVDRILELHQHFHGDYVVMLKDKTRLILSRRYRRRLGAAIGDL